MASVIKDETGTVKAHITVAAKYFRRETETLKDFNEQWKQLDEASKEELAVGATKELGYTVEA